MLKYLEIGRFQIPTYGLCVWFGILLCGFLAQIVIYQKELPFYRVNFLLACCGAGALLGAKGMTLGRGYAYFGGLFGFLTVGGILIKILELKKERVVQAMFFLLPLLHVFWKIGCFMAGCCEGIIAFPVQLIESGIALVLAGILYVAPMIKKDSNVVSLYLIGYGSTRFFIEFLRVQKHTSLLTGRVCAVCCVVVGVCLLRWMKRGKTENERKRTENL